MYSVTRVVDCFINVANKIFYPAPIDQLRSICNRIKVEPTPQSVERNLGLYKQALKIASYCVGDQYGEPWVVNIAREIISNYGTECKVSKDGYKPSQNGKLHYTATFPAYLAVPKMIIEATSGDWQKSVMRSFTECSLVENNNRNRHPDEIDPNKYDRFLRYYDQNISKPEIGADLLDLAKGQPYAERGIVAGIIAETVALDSGYLFHTHHKVMDAIATWPQEMKKGLAAEINKAFFLNVAPATSLIPDRRSYIGAAIKEALSEIAKTDPDFDISSTRNFVGNQSTATAFQGAHA